MDNSVPPTPVVLECSSDFVRELLKTDDFLSDEDTVVPDTSDIGELSSDSSAQDLNSKNTGHKTTRLKKIKLYNSSTTQRKMTKLRLSDLQIELKDGSGTSISSCTEKK